MLAVCSGMLEQGAVGVSGNKGSSLCSKMPGARNRPRSSAAKKWKPIRRPASMKRAAFAPPVMGKIMRYRDHVVCRKRSKQQ